MKNRNKLTRDLILLETILEQSDPGLLSKIGSATLRTLSYLGSMASSLVSIIYLGMATINLSRMLKQQSEPIANINPQLYAETQTKSSQSEAVLERTLVELQQLKQRLATLISTLQQNKNLTPEQIKEIKAEIETIKAEIEKRKELVNQIKSDLEETKEKVKEQIEEVKENNQKTNQQPNPQTVPITQTQVQPQTVRESIEQQFPYTQLDNYRNRVSVIIIGKNKRILVGVNPDPSKPDNIVIPGGGIEEGESIEDAARREVLEEVGAIIDNITPLDKLTIRVDIPVEVENKFYNGAVNHYLLATVKDIVDYNTEFIPKFVSIKDLYNFYTEHIKSITGSLTWLVPILRREQFILKKLYRKLNSLVNLEKLKRLHDKKNLDKSKNKVYKKLFQYKVLVYYENLDRDSEYVNNVLAWIKNYYKYILKVVYYELKKFFKEKINFEEDSISLYVYPAKIVIHDADLNRYNILFRLNGTRLDNYKILVEIDGDNIKSVRFFEA